MSSVTYAPVKFKIEADNKPALKAIDEVEARSKNLKPLKIEFKMPTAKRLQEVTKKLLEMSAAMGTFSGAGNFKTFAEGMEKLGSVKISKSLVDFFRDSEVTERMKDLAQTVSEFPDTSNFVEFTKGLANLNGVKLNGGVGKFLQNATVLQNEMPTWDQGLSKPVSYDIDEGPINKVGKAILFAAENWDTFKRGAVKALKTAISYTGKFLTTLKNLAVSGFNKLTDSLKKSTAGISSFMNSIGRIALYRAIRSAIKEVTQAFNEGIQNLYRWSRLNDGVFANSMNKLSSTALQLKNTLGAMLAPVINALVPIVEKAAQAFMNVANAVNQFISALTGASTWTKAVYTPITYAQAMGSSFDKAEKKAKKLKNSILGFDEINRLEDNTDNSSSSTTDELPYGSMFTQEPLSDFWKKWFNTDDWYDLGKLFALKANDWLKKVDEWILGTFRPWALTWAKRLATFLNGFVDWFDFRLLGKTIADGMMAIIDSVNLFFDLFQAKNFGARLWETVDEWFKNMNWESVGQFFANGINFVADVASGFFEKFVTNAEEYGKDLAIAFQSWVKDIHWDNIRSALSNGLASIAGVIRGFVSNENGAWDTFKAEFLKTINSVISSPSVTELMEAGAQLVNQIIEMLKDLDWYSVGYQIGTFLGNIDWMNALLTVGSALVKGLWGAIRGAFDADNGAGLLGAAAIVAGIGGAFTLAKTLIGGTLNGFAMSLGQQLATSMTGALGAEGLGAAVLGSMGWIAGIGALLAEVAVVGYGIYEWFDTQNALAEARANETAAQVKLQAAFAANGIQVSLEQIDGYLNGTMSVADLTGGKFQSLAQIASQSSSQMSSNVSSNLSNVAKQTEKTFEDVSGATFDFTDSVNSSIVKFLTSASDGSEESMRQLADSTVAIFNDVSEAVSKINQALSNSFSQMASSISQSMQRMYDSVSTNMAKIASNVENAAARIQSAFNSVSSVSTTVKVEGYATGGFPEDGLFMANSGELVGGFTNGRTAVANNDQIIEGIESGVYNAVTNALSGQSSGGDIVIRIDSEEIARASIRGQRNLDRRMNPTVKFTG